MKKIIFTLCCLFFSAALSAQDKAIKAFENYCIDVSEAYRVKDFSALEKCISGYKSDTTKFEYAKTTIGYLPLVKNDSFQKADSTGEAIWAGHCLFLPQWLDDFIMRNEIVDINNATILRDKNGIDFYYYVSAIKPSDSVSYNIKCTGNIEMFVVGENNLPLKLTAEGMVKKDKQSELANLCLSDTSNSQKPSAHLSWNMYNRSDITITIENISEETASFIWVVRL